MHTCKQQTVGNIFRKMYNPPPPPSTPSWFARSQLHVGRYRMCYRNLLFRADMQLHAFSSGLQGHGTAQRQPDDGQLPIGDL